MTINGKAEKFPPYPHPKDSVRRMKQFLSCRSMWDYTKADQFAIVKEVYRGVRHHSVMSRIMLVDPTNACNLRCKGCWAADYDKAANLDYATLTDLVSQAKKLGVRDIMMTGGEPMTRREDIFKLAREHPDMSFWAFTNGTLIGAREADITKELGNLSYFISLEGFEEDTDFRRGPGVYQQIIRAMALLKERDIAFGFSACYHALNYQTIVSDAFLEDMRARGAWCGWLFNYLPIGSDADLSLVCTPEQRLYVMNRVDQCIREKDMVLYDFMNLGHAIYGCVAASNGYMHVNAHGDVEPCAFCHYSDANIHDMPLIDAMRSPFFRRFRQSQPFSSNPMRACPMMDVPEALPVLVKEGGAHSTHYGVPETAEALTAKTAPIAKAWKKASDEAVKTMDPQRVRMYARLSVILRKRRRLTDGRQQSVRP